MHRREGNGGGFARATQSFPGLVECQAPRNTGQAFLRESGTFNRKGAVVPRLCACYGYHAVRGKDPQLLLLLTAKLLLWCCAHRSSPSPFSTFDSRHQ